MARGYKIFPRGKEFRDNFDDVFREKIYCTVEEHYELFQNDISICPKCGHLTDERIGRNDPKEDR